MTRLQAGEFARFFDDDDEDLYAGAAKRVPPPADPATILCAVSEADNAIGFSGVGGGKIVLVFDDTQDEQVKKLLAMRGRLLEMTFRVGHF